MIKAVILFVLMCSAWSYCTKTWVSAEPDIMGMSISPDGNYLASAHSTGVANLYSLPNLTKVKVHNFTVWADGTSYSKDGQYIAVAGSKNYVDILNATTFQLIISLHTQIYPTHKADFSFNNQKLIVCGENSIIQIWSVSNWSRIQNISTNFSNYMHCRYASNGGAAATGHNGSVLLDGNGNIVRSYPYGQLYRVTPHFSGQYFLFSSYNQFFSEADWNGIATNYSVGLTEAVDSDYSLDSKYLAVGLGNGIIHFYNATNRNNTLIKIMNPGGASTKLFGFQFSPNSQYLALANSAIGRIYLL